MKSCATCSKFTKHEPSKAQWGDCLHGRPMVKPLRETQHRDNGTNCPRYVPIQGARP